jgi:WS/DGAT/MGAT family acyltransferase
MNHKGERVVDTMSGADALLWTIGRNPVLRPTVIAVMVLDKSPDWATLQSRVTALTEIVPRLRSHAVVRPWGRGRPQFIEDRQFDLALHLRRMALPSGSTFRDVLDIAQTMGTTGFDPFLPLWEVVETDSFDGERAALIVKLHHSLVDGVGGFAVLAHLLDTERNPSTPRAPVSAESGSTTAFDLMKYPQGLRKVVDAAFGAVVRPVESIQHLASAGASVARLLAPARQPISSLMTERSFRRVFEVVDLPQGKLRRAATAMGGTLNDAFVASVVRGLKRYHELHGVVLNDIRALMPVNVRAKANTLDGNHFVPARFVVPTGTDASECLRAVQRITDQWKHAPGLALSDVLANALSFLPSPVATSLWGSMLKGDDFCVTNIPGPAFKVFVASSRVERIYAFAPPSGAALNVSLITLAGREYVGIAIDSAAVSDSSKLAVCIEEGFGEVFELGRLRPRGH